MANKTTVTLTKEQYEEINGLPKLYTTDYFLNNHKTITKVEDILLFENNNQPYFIYFYMKDCEACKGVSGEIQKSLNDGSIKEIGNVYFVDMDEDENRWLWNNLSEPGLDGSNISFELANLKVKRVPAVVKVDTNSGFYVSTDTTPCINLIKGK